MVETSALLLTVAAICEQHAGRAGALLPILHDVQNRFGCIAAEAVKVIAAHLNLTRAEVGGVVSFYTDFKTTPAAARVIKVCRAEACQANGGAEVWDAALVAAAAAPGMVEVEAVYCLGNCACGPSVQVNGQTLGRVDRQRMVTLVSSPDGE